MPTFAPARLDSVLLTVQDINIIMGSNAMQVNGGTDDRPDTTPNRYSNPECTSVLEPFQNSEYQGSGFTSLRAQSVKDDVPHEVLQGATTFPTADRALAFVKNMEAKWKSCAGQSIAQTFQNGNTARWTLGNLTGDAPSIALVATQENGGGFACQRLQRAVSNVVLDITACSNQLTDQGSQVADKMAAKVTQ